MSKASELREKSVEELTELLEEQQKELFKWRMQHASGELGQPHLLRSTRREVARIKTLLNERLNESAAQEQA